MDKIGISFRAQLDPDQMREKYIQPLRTAITEARAGVYANYLRQADPEAIAPAEHLIVFEVNDFKESLRLLRLELEKLDVPEGIQFQNLNPSSPSY